jgi:hypothetical protein
VIQIRYQGRNIFTNSISTTKYQLVGQEISVGSGLGKYDKEIILPFYLVKERILTSISEILLVGGEQPDYGIVNIFTEDKDSAEELIRCMKTVGAELELELDYSIALVKNSSTSFIINLYSSVSKEKLKLKTARESLWIYFLRLREDSLGIAKDNFFNIEFIKEIAASQGILESYLLKDESFSQGISNMLAGTNSFHVERNHNLDVLKKYRRGSGMILLSPFKLSKIDEKNVEIHEMGSLFTKSFKY